MNNYKFPANAEIIDDMMEPILSSLKENNVEFKKIYQMNLALEEILVNICKYAYEDNQGIIDISYEISGDPKKLKVIIKDKGKAFDPLKKKDPDLDSDAEKRQIGGLGIYIVKNLVDDIKYQRANDENILEFIKQL